MQDKNSTNILVLDDDEIILIALRENLIAQGYSVTTANKPSGAIELLQEQAFSVIISDQRMPEMSGLEFFERVKEIQPHASRILITGVLKLDIVIDAINKGEIFRFIAKPWIREELIATVKNAVQRYHLVVSNERLQKETLALNESLANSNRDLQQKIEEISAQKAELAASKKALEKNLERSMELCYQLTSSFHAILGEHAKAAMDLCQLLVDNGPFTQKEQHVLKASASLYNLGLIGVSRDLLSRYFKGASNLTTDEKKLIHHYPCYGETLAFFVDDLEDVAKTIRSHKERWDGSGFPDGLAGESIPKLARYLSVVVHYIQSSASRDDTLESIINLSGKHFDPEAVRLFLKVTRVMSLPRKVKEIMFSDLREGMSLAKGLYSPTGLLLIPQGHVLNSHSLKKIQEHNRVYPIHEELLVYG